MTAEFEPPSELPTPSSEAVVNLPHPEHTYSAVIAAWSLVLGFIGQLFFYSFGVGVNAPLYVFLLLVGVFVGLNIIKPTIFNLNWFMAIPAFLFACLIAWIVSDSLNIFNFCMLAVALYLLVRFASNPIFLGGSWRAGVISGIESAFAEWFLAPLMVSIGLGQWLRRAELNSSQMARTQAVLRGLLLTIPIVLIFGGLLASADVVFGDLLGDLFAWVDLDFNNLVGRVIVWGFFSWICLIGYKILFLGGVLNSLDETLQQPMDMQKAFRLGMIETGMVLGSVNALFLGFVLIQARYFFGGQDNITETGYTYADYARRGFSEMVLVSFLTLALVLFLDAFTHRKNATQHQFFRALTIGMILMTGVILVSAFQRLSLYEEAYGYTRLRLISHVFIIWLAVLFAVCIVDILREGKRFFWMAGVVVVFGYVLTLNLVNMDAFIARNNIQRFEETGKIDVYYLAQLSDDAIPQMVKLIEMEALPDGERAMLYEFLGWRLYKLDEYRAKRGVLGYHLGKERAWNALEDYRETLGDYVKPSRPYFSMY